jgi:hypothetical protein
MIDSSGQQRILQFGNLPVGTEIKDMSDMKTSDICQLFFVQFSQRAAAEKLAIPDDRPSLFT